MRLGITMFATDRTVAAHELASAAEERGFSSLYLPEHTHIPVSRLTPGPATKAASGTGERMLRVFLSVWDDPAHRLPLLGLVRGLLEPSGRKLVRDGFLDVVVGPIGAALGIDEPERRMPLVASQVFGLIIVRYLLEVEPLASMPPDQVVAIYAPTIQRYLTGPLP